MCVPDEENSMPAGHFVEALPSEKELLLIDCYRHTHDADLRSRCQMVLLSSRATSVAQIAALTFFSEDTVLYWIERYQTEGIDGLSERPRSGRPPKSLQHVR
jgi:hypothetical protein